jgi:alanine racemase
MRNSLSRFLDDFCMPRPIRATIDLGALRHNFDIARHYAGVASIWAVIKANGYGHGLLRVAGALAGLTDGYALIELEAALALREAGINEPILMMEGFYDAEELPLFAEHRLTPVVHTLEQVDMFLGAGLPTRLPLCLKLNTGMNRLGFGQSDFAPVLDRLATSGLASSLMLMSHFADADEKRGVAEQLACFKAMRGDCTVPFTLANSGALLRFPETTGGSGDWVRPGIMLYGSSPFPWLKSAADLGLRPVMTLASELIGVQQLAVGDRVGYGGSFVADKPMRIGLVACGYGDGYPRHAPTGTPILVGGRRTRTLGRVSMDKIAVDLADISAAGIRTPVTLWGEGLPADEVAAAAGTVSYELFCALNARVPVVER